MDKSKITKQNGNIAFEEEAHIYYDVTKPEQKFISVTTLIHSFTQPFDKEFWSAYKALEKLLPKEDWAIEKKSLLNTKKFDKVLLELHNITEDEFNKEQQAILDAWDMENRNSCERGTRIHADLENSFYKKKKDIDLSKYQIGGKFECIKDYNNLDLENGVYPEYLISRVSEDGKLRIAGQIDLLVKRGNKIIIGDWKTNKKIETKSFFNSKTKTSVKMKYPLNNLDDVNYWHYALQLSTYAWMIQKKNPEFEIEDLVLVHFDHSDNMTVYHLPIGGKFECIKDYNNLDLENGVYPEYLISRVSEDGKLRIAGQIDLLVKRGNKIIIGDWKTNKKIETKSFFNSKTKTSVKMKYPLNNLDDVNYWHYALQLSTYAWMIQKKNPEFEIEDLVLVHFDHSDNMTVYHLPYLKDEVIRMLSFYKKESILAENKKKRQRIEY